MEHAANFNKGAFMAVSEDKRREWEDKIERQKASGLTVHRWCNGNQTSISAFYTWKNRLDPKPMTRSNFNEIIDKKTFPSKSSDIAIEYQGVVIRIDKHCDVSILKNCLRALKGTRC